jgi:S1-C subfamily serine protease
MSFMPGLRGYCAVAIGIIAINCGSAQTSTNESIPVATQWLMDAAGSGGRDALTSVFKIWCSKTQALGTGFVLDTGYMVTNAHVVGGCGAADLVVISSTGVTLFGVFSDHR